MKEKGPLTAARAALISSTEWGDSNCTSRRRLLRGKRATARSYSPRCRRRRRERSTAPSRQIRIELVLHVDRCSIASDGLVEWHNLYASTLRLALAPDRLVV